MRPSVRSPTARRLASDGESPRVGPHGGQQAVPARHHAGVDEHQRRADQADQRRRHVRRPGHPPHVGERERAGEEAQPVQQAAFRVGQPAMAGTDHVVQQPVVERRQDVGRGEGRGACGGTLDRERKGVESPADPRREHRFRHRTPHRPHAVGQQPCRVHVGQRRYGDHPLPRHVQRPATGDQHPQRRAAGQQRGQRRHDVGEQMVGVVDDDEHGPVADAVGEPTGRRDRHPHRLRHDRGETARVAKPGQVDEPGAVRVTATPGHLLRQPGLAHPGRTGQRDQATGVESGGGRGQLGRPPDERRDGRRDVARPDRSSGEDGLVLAQDRRLHAAQLRARIDALLVGQVRAGPPEHRQRVRLPPRPVQGRRQQTPSALPERFLDDERLQVPDRRPVAAERQQRRHPQLRRGGVQRVQSGPLRDRERGLSDVGVGRAAPERQAFAERRLGLLRTPVHKRAAARHEGGEAVRVQALRRNPQGVPGTVTDQHPALGAGRTAGLQHGAQPGHVPVQGGAARRRPALPQTRASIRSTGIIRPRAASSAASTVRCRRPPSGTGSPSRLASSGPSTNSRTPSIVSLPLGAGSASPRRHPETRVRRPGRPGRRRLGRTVECPASRTVGIPGSGARVVPVGRLGRPL